MNLSNDNMIHIKKDGIEYLQFKKLLEYDDILVHAFTLSPLDFGNYEIYKENKEPIIENYKKICKPLELNYKNIIRPVQMHSHNIKTVNQIGIYETENFNVDGLITKKANQILSLTYADCIPLYFFDPNKKVIANIHSGWQGTIKRIGKLAVEKLVNEYGSNPKDLICAIGPSIRKCHFEVDEEVKEKFRIEFSDIKDLETIILKGDIIEGKQKYYIDTVELNKKMLNSVGLKEENIIDSNICTVCNSDLIYSYRGNNKTKSRNTSLICLK